MLHVRAIWIGGAVDITLRHLARMLKLLISLLDPFALQVKKLTDFKY